MNADWLQKYPKAAALLQQAADGEQADAELDYAPDGAPHMTWFDESNEALSPADRGRGAPLSLANAQRLVNEEESAHAEALHLAPRAPWNAPARVTERPDDIVIAIRTPRDPWGPQPYEAYCLRGDMMYTFGFFDPALEDEIREMLTEFIRRREAEGGAPLPQSAGEPQGDPMTL